MATVDQRLVRIEQALEEFPDFPQPGVLFRYTHTQSLLIKKCRIFYECFLNILQRYISGVSRSSAVW